MIDLHCHILPGLDDGAATVEESCRMARLAVGSGVTDIAATPHCMPGRFENFAGPALERALGELRRRLAEEGIPLRLHAGMEVFATPELPRQLEEGQLLTLGGSRYLLIEFAFGETEWFVQRTLRAVEAGTLVPVIAHPERYYFVQDNPAILSAWAEEGRVIQLNKGSFFGMFGRRAARAAHWCLDRGCVHLIGSDAHSPYRRTTRLEDIYDYAADFTAPEIADLLLRDNPAAILADRPIASVRERF